MSSSIWGWLGARGPCPRKRRAWSGVKHTIRSLIRTSGPFAQGLAPCLPPGPGSGNAGEDSPDSSPTTAARRRLGLRGLRVPGRPALLVRHSVPAAFGGPDGDPQPPEDDACWRQGDHHDEGRGRDLAQAGGGYRAPGPGEVEHVAVHHEAGGGPGRSSLHSGGPSQPGPGPFHLHLEPTLQSIQFTSHHPPG